MNLNDMWFRKAVQCATYRISHNNGPVFISYLVTILNPQSHLKLNSEYIRCSKPFEFYNSFSHHNNNRNQRQNHPYQTNTNKYP